MATHSIHELYFPEVSSGRMIDVFTQKGGIGLSEPSPPFELGENLELFAIVTYNEDPIPNKYVSFQLVDPFENTYVFSGRTNSTGIATTGFRFPSIVQEDEMSNMWTVFASVDIGGLVAIDTLEFIVWWNIADINYDWKVDISDIVLVNNAYGTTLLDNNWNPRYDLSEQYGLVDISDIVVACENFGERL